MLASDACVDRGVRPLLLAVESRDNQIAISGSSNSNRGARHRPNTVPTDHVVVVPLAGMKFIRVQFDLEATVFNVRTYGRRSSCTDESTTACARMIVDEGRYRLHVQN